MPGGAASYRKGAEFEREVKKFLEEQGWFVMRSPKSASPVDLLAIGPGSGQAHFIQCKMRGYYPKAEAKELFELANRYWGEAVLVKKGKDGPLFAYVNRRGEKSTFHGGI